MAVKLLILLSELLQKQHALSLQFFLTEVSVISVDASSRAARRAWLVCASLV
jgi:hypothetical protein